MPDLNISDLLWYAVYDRLFINTCHVCEIASMHNLLGQTILYAKTMG